METPIHRVFLTARSCYIVQTETNQIAAYLNANGYELVDSAEKADAIIITTCAVTETAAEATVQGILDCIRGRRDDAPVYVVGCYSRIEPERMEEISKLGNVIPLPEVKDIEKEFLGTHPWATVEYNNFWSHPFAVQRMNYAYKASLQFKIVKKGLSVVDTICKTETCFHFFLIASHLYNPEIQRVIWPILVSKGCTHACSYCAVRKGRGKYTSKPIPSVLREVRLGIDRGYKRILLIGDELGPYGVDLKGEMNLSGLLDYFRSEDLAIKVGLWYLDAFEMTEVLESLKVLAGAGKIFFLGITIQHGSSRILELMNRHYSLDDTMKGIEELRKYSTITIATQFMVGFPTETDEDFQETLRLVQTGYFDIVEVFEYSPRPGTKAAKMIDDVPPEVKAERAKVLRRASRWNSTRLFMRHVRDEFRSVMRFW